MKLAEIKSVFENFKSISNDFQIRQLTSGHINQTYLIRNAGEKFILQKINTSVFKNLNLITTNIGEVSRHLNKKSYPHKILKPLAFRNGEFVWDDEWRLFDFFENSKTYEKVLSPEQAFEAAQFLREFHIYLKDLDLEKITDSIPGFLDFNMRFQQFEKSLKSASEKRLAKAESEIKKIQQYKHLLESWNLNLPKFPIRIIHADPKISNFLFSQNDENKIVAIVDWDTLMTGPLLYDFGDMVRSYTNLRAEDDSISGENFSLENYTALKKGFLNQFPDELTELEKESMGLAGQTVVYIQAIRFLTDYLNNDQYFSTTRPDHNLDRTQNQLNLLKEMMRKI